VGAYRLSLLVAAVLAVTLAGLGRDGEVAASGSPSATALALGWIHTCALTGVGGVMCWGFNAHNELGDGTRVDRWRPVGVSGLGGGVRAITAGARHGCALTAGGGLKCWGYNYYGQLGDGTNVNRSAAVDVSGLGIGVSAVSAGAFHTCALTTGGGVQCWGENGAGELGDGTTVERWSPAGVSGLAGGAIAVAGADRHSCAIVRGGGVKCWGDNGYGQLGDGTTRRRLTPVDVRGLSGPATALALGNRHSCALLVGGGLACWGGNLFGQLGDGTTRRRPTAVGVSGLGGAVSAIAAGDSHTCVLTRSGGMKCWGYNNWSQLGDGTALDRLRPVGVSGMGSGVTAIAAGTFHSCARTRTGNAKCWGDNGNGQLGDGTPDTRSRPVYVFSLGPAPVELSIVPASPLVTSTRGAEIRLHCRAVARCVGTLWLSASVRGGLARLGERAFSISAGTTTAVRVKLSPRAFGLVAAARRLPVRAHVRYAQADGTTSEQSRPITLRTP
jgi:alpha-tubulin suppressor-like RCC1 family protein